MSTTRWKNLPPVRQDRYGYYLCRLCQSPCPGTERQWCSQACMQRYITMASGTFVRFQLLQRDRGICSECGVDAQRMDIALSRLLEDLLHPLLMTIHPMVALTLRSEGWSNIRLRSRGSYSDAISFTSCWEAHHIKSVAEGGGECDLDNYRTLCFVCHKRISAEQAAARAEKRRQEKRAAKLQREAAKQPVPLFTPLPDDVIPF